MNIINYNFNFFIMKKNMYLFLMLALFFNVSSCEENDKESAPTITSIEIGSTSAVLGDEVSFSVSVQKGGEALSSIKAQAYLGEELLSETFFPTNISGTLSGKLYIPYRPNLEEEAFATLRFVAKDRLFNFSSQTKDISLSYPLIASLTFVAANGNYSTTAQADGSYKVDQLFPSKIKGFLDLLTDKGRQFRFGLNNGVIAADGSDSIVFQGEDPSVPFEIVFNPRTYFASPMSDYVDLSFEEGVTVKTVLVEQNQAIAVSGIDISAWWINPTFFSKNADGKLRFKAITGFYRITADATLKYLKVDPMDKTGDAVATFDPATGEGAVWINGNNGIGLPNYASNTSTAWPVTKSFAMAPMGNKIYKLYIDSSILNYANINFKFYKDSGNGEYFNKPDETIVSGTPLFKVDTSTNNVGNIRAGETALQSGKAYILTLDCTNIPAVLTAEIDE
jgi:hypothetical protein